MVVGEPDWRLWALWLALQLRLVLRRGGDQQARDRIRRDLDQFTAEVRRYEQRRWPTMPRDQPG